MDIFFSSDSHYGHANIIKYCSRPYESVWQMNTDLASKWNALIRPDDIVIHLGDVTLIRDANKYTETINLIRNLSGRKLLIYGNHDHARMLPNYGEWGWRVLDKLQIEDILLVHEPPLIKPESVNLVLHGHSHGKLGHKPGYIDLGVDAQPNYAPINARQILNEKQYNALVFSLTKIMCQHVMPQTFDICGEHANFCSLACRELKNK